MGAMAGGLALDWTISKNQSAARSPQKTGANFKPSSGNDYPARGQALPISHTPILTEERMT